MTPQISGEYFSFFTLFGPYPHLDRKPLDFAAKTFFCFGLHILWGRKPTHFAAKTIFLDQKMVLPRNPAPGATIFSNATDRH